MAENNQKPAHSFFRFFGISIAEGWAESREKFGLAVDITLALAAFGILWLTWYSKHHGDFNEQSWEGRMNYWFAVIPVGLWVAWFIYHVMKSAHNLYLKEWEKAENERAKHDGEKAALQSENQSITEKLAEKSEADKLVLERQGAKNTLGIDLMALNKRLGEAREISRYDFVDKVKDDAWTATNELFFKVQSDLALKLTLAEYSRFNITVGESVKEITDDPYHGQRKMDWLWHYNCILAKREKLAEIIKELG